MNYKVGDWVKVLVERQWRKAIVRAVNVDKTGRLEYSFEFTPKLYVRGNGEAFGGVSYGNKMQPRKRN
jgi:hypothetical protein